MRGAWELHRVCLHRSLATPGPEGRGVVHCPGPDSVLLWPSINTDLQQVVNSTCSILGDSLYLLSVGLG